jgi:hypothetical protein
MQSRCGHVDAKGPTALNRRKRPPAKTIYLHSALCPLAGKVCTNFCGIRFASECTGVAGAAAAAGEAAEGAATAWVLGLIPRTSGRGFVLRISARCIRRRSRTGH